VAGGEENTASGSLATVGGGEVNRASGSYATVGGGRYNTAAGQYSLAAGRQAKANHDGTFVWGDSQAADFASTGTDQFLIRAQGGVAVNTNSPQSGYQITIQGSGYARSGSWVDGSSKRWKTNIERLQNALEKVRALRGVSYDWKEDGRHDIGLVAEEVAEVVPEVVRYEANGKDAIGVDYDHLVGLLVEAAKDLDRKIESEDDLIALVMDLLEQHDRKIGKQEELVAMLSKYMEELGSKVEKQELLEMKVAEQEKTIQNQQVVIEGLVQRLQAIEEKIGGAQTVTPVSKR
jgi:uncharacterized coiled-coil protein SlyX